MKKTALDLLKNCQSYSYVGDLRTGYYHTLKCPVLSEIPIEFARGCGKKPRKSGLIPCPVCLDLAVFDNDFIYPMQFKQQQNYLVRVKHRTKSQIMKEQLLLLGGSLGMHLSFIGSTLYVTTIVGEWYFDFNNRPINLHHMSNSSDLEKYTAPRKPYHQQKQTFSTPAHALAYIYCHEKATIKRITSAFAIDNYI